MKKVNFSLETIVAPQDVIQNELEIRGGTSPIEEPIDCHDGKVKSKCKTGDVESESSLTPW